MQPSFKSQQINKSKKVEVIFNLFEFFFIINLTLNTICAKYPWYFVITSKAKLVTFVKMYCIRLFKTVAMPWQHEMDNLGKKIKLPRVPTEVLLPYAKIHRSENQPIRKEECLSSVNHASVRASHTHPPHNAYHCFAAVHYCKAYRLSVSHRL